MSEITPEHEQLIENYNLTLTLVEVANMQPLMKQTTINRLIQNNRIDKVRLQMLIEVCESLVNRQIETYFFSNGEQVNVSRLHKALLNLVPLTEES